MKYTVSLAIGAGAIFGALAFTPTLAEILVESTDEDSKVYIMLDRESDAGNVTREYYDGSHVAIEEENTNGHILRMQIDDGDTVSTCVRIEMEDGDRPLTCITNTDRDETDHVFFADSEEDLREAEHDLREVMREHEHEMAEFEREMAEFDREMAAFGQEMANIDWGMEGLAAAAAEIAEMASHLQENIMAELAESGLRIESDGHGNETVWIDSDGEDDPAMRVVSGANGSDLVFMYFDGFERPYHYVIEDDERGDDSTTIHAYDVSTVEIVETRGRDGNIETETTRDGGPHLTVHTRNPDHIRVIRLDRSRFDG